MLFDRSSPERSFRHWSERVDGLLCGRLMCVYSNPSVLQLCTIGADLLLNLSSLPPKVDHRKNPLLIHIFINYSAMDRDHVHPLRFKEM
ncbi:hypothetical protein CgunFtcFv8_017547 [Champsocephalus gunnari]|uniref:Uncharacterized protein n=1 Tax=Champsocephalus gunnari TaxID=52237 RepID=A0AAN8HRI4_CHAGU|nr:hypothetical protein CgunFtcFv8_017547 [Champsocephalus gunnari]